MRAASGGGHGAGWSLGPVYGLGYLGVTVLTQVVSIWLFYYYVPPEGTGLAPYAPAAAVGLALAVGRVVDAVADPLVGVASDNLRSPWGRRRPFILVGTPLCVAFFLALWYPPVAGAGTLNAVWLGVMATGFFIFFTVVVAPYLALLPALQRDLGGRVNLATWQAVFSLLGLGLGMAGAALLIEAAGFAVMAWVMGAVVLVSFWVPGYLLREPPRAPERALGLRQALAWTAANRPFRYHVAGQACFWFGFNLILMSTPYFVSTVLGLAAGDVAVVLGLAAGVAVLTFPVLAKLTPRWGTRSLLLIAAAWLAVCFALLGTLGSWPGGLPVVWQGYIVFAAAGVGLAGHLVLPNTILAEVTDHDEGVTGRRREAVFYGVQGFVVKLAIGLSALAVSVLLTRYGFSAEEPLGVLLHGPVAAAAMVLGMLAFWGFPLGRPIEDRGDGFR